MIFQPFFLSLSFHAPIQLQYKTLKRFLNSLHGTSQGPSSVRELKTNTPGPEEYATTPNEKSASTHSWLVRCGAATIKQLCPQWPLPLTVQLKTYAPKPEEYASMTK